MDCIKKKLYDPKTDEMFKIPYIDQNEIRTRDAIFGPQVHYRYLHGGFEGTGVKFIFCFPLKDQFKMRNFISIFPPFPGPDEASWQPF